MTAKSIHILGDGITAKALQDKCPFLGIKITSLEEAELIIASPGIPPSMYPSTNKEIISEIELAYRLLQNANKPPLLIAVTGTNGKSTVTALISHVLDIPYAGNIGIPLINYVGFEDEFDKIVVEVSSYQLEQSSQFKPHISVLLNISEDHLRRHHTLENYIAQKKKCIQNKTKDDYIVYNEDDDLIKKMLKGSPATCIPFSEKETLPNNIIIPQLPGPHNKSNMLAAIKVASILDIKENQCLSQFLTFKSLKHRLEMVKEIKNIKFYNDSKSTNPDSTIKALSTFPEKVHLILCGEDKQVDYTHLIKKIKEKAKTISIFGEISNKINEQLKDSSSIPIFLHKNINNTVENLKTITQPHDIVLFSPSSSSYDQFQGFENRGNKFCECIELYYENSN